MPKHPGAGVVRVGTGGVANFPSFPPDLFAFTDLSTEAAKE